MSRSGKTGKWINAPASAPRQTPMKDPVTGIMPRGYAQISGRASDLGGVVVDIKADDLWPDGLAAAHDESVLDDLDAALGSMAVRCRVHWGIHAPSDVRAMAGGPIYIVDPTDSTLPLYDTIEEVPVWWSAENFNAWATAMMFFANRYESTANFREVASHPATTHYAEPFQRGTKERAIAISGPNAGKNNMEVFTDAGNAGHTPKNVGEVGDNIATIGPAAVEQAALLWPTEVLPDGRTRWRSFGFETTRLYLPVNPYQGWKPTTFTEQDPANPDKTYYPSGFRPETDPGSWTATFIGRSSTDMRARLVLGNNSLRVPLIQAGPKYPTMYNNLTSAISTQGFQTATTTRLRDAYRTVASDATIAQALAATLDVAFGVITADNDPLGLVTSPVHHLRARSVELPDGWSSHLTSEQCAYYNTLAEAMPIGTTRLKA